MKCYLKDIDTDEKYPLCDEAVFGRSEGTYVFPNCAKMSRSHCRIVKLSNQYYLVDLNSRNGTLVNAVRCEPNEKILLTPNSIIIFGDRNFIFKVHTGQTDLLELKKKS